MRLYDFVMPIIALVIVIVLFISIRLAGRATKVLEQDKESRPDLIPFLKYRHNWLQISVCLQAIELICIILAFAATAMTIFVVTRIPVDGENLSKIVTYSTLSFLFSLVNIVFRPMKQAQAYKKHI